MRAVSIQFLLFFWRHIVLVIQFQGQVICCMLIAGKVSGMFRFNSTNPKTAAVCLDVPPRLVCLVVASPHHKVPLVVPDHTTFLQVHKNKPPQTPRCVIYLPSGLLEVPGYSTQLGWLSIVQPKSTWLSLVAPPTTHTPGCHLALGCPS